MKYINKYGHFVLLFFLGYIIFGVAFPTKMVYANSIIMLWVNVFLIELSLFIRGVL